MMHAHDTMSDFNNVLTYILKSIVVGAAWNEETRDDEDITTIGRNEVIRGEAAGVVTGTMHFVPVTLRARLKQPDVFDVVNDNFSATDLMRVAVSAELSVDNLGGFAVVDDFKENIRGLMRTYVRNLHDSHEHIFASVPEIDIQGKADKDDKYAVSVVLYGWTNRSSAAP